MKLLYCTTCGDIVALRRGIPANGRKCLCGEAGGGYDPDGLHAWISGPAVPLGFENQSWIRAMVGRPTSGMGTRFVAFVIPKECDTVRVIDETP